MKAATQFSEGPSLDRIRVLARMVGDKKAQGTKFVLMLGAGASLSSGVKLTRTIMQELVDRYGAKGTDSLEDKFDKLWSSASENDRLMYMKQYLEGTPSPGYDRLADLIQRGFFDIVLTFNFDVMLETALNRIGFNDYKAIIRGETSTDAFPKLVDSREPRVKIVKLHGSLRSADYFLFSKEEMLNYPQDVQPLIRDLTGRDIIICGYAFSDVCVIRAFNDSKEGGSIYYVNPSGATDNVKGFLAARRSQDRVIGGDAGKFDAFFDALHRELLNPEKAAPLRGQNFFKFLDFYSKENSQSFLGRRRLTRGLLAQLKESPKALYLCGRPKVGKTSFIHAGLISHLDANECEVIYIRCRQDVEAQFRSELQNRFPGFNPGSDWSTLSQLKQFTPKKVVVFFDQFERPIRILSKSGASLDQLLQFVNALVRNDNDRLTTVFVAVDEAAYLKFVLKLKTDHRDLIEVEPLSARRVRRIINVLGRKGGINFDPEIIRYLCAKYQEALDNSDGGKGSFTLTHIQTLCYYLARGFQQNWEGYDRLPNPALLVALDASNEDSGLADLIADMRSEERRVIRNALKIICDPNTNMRAIVEFIKAHFPDLTRDESFPEVI